MERLRFLLPRMQKSGAIRIYPITQGKQHTNLEIHTEKCSAYEALHGASLTMKSLDQCTCGIPHVQWNQDDNGNLIKNKTNKKSSLQLRKHQKCIAQISRKVQKEMYQETFPYRLHSIPGTSHGYTNPLWSSITTLLGQTHGNSSLFLTLPQIYLGKRDPANCGLDVQREVGNTDAAFGFPERSPL